MRSRDLWQIYAIHGGAFLDAHQWSPGFRAGEPIPTTRFEWVWKQDPMDAGMWSRRNCELHLAGSGGRSIPINPDHARIVRAPHCGCCGVVSIWLRCVGAGEPPESLWRCEKHVGRLPCLIEGCGKTWAMKGDETYDVRCVCGKHWRLAPRYMRDLCTRLRRQAKRRGWDDRLSRIYGAAFDRAVRAVEKRLGGNIDLAEIERLFGV